MNNLFICYRREDSADFTGRIYDRLAAKFGTASVFKDVDSIPIGVDFREHLAAEVSKCDVLLVVIGEDWISISDNGSRRLDQPNDFVRIEIESALSRDIPVVPLLVNGTDIPVEASLPDSIKHLAYRHGINIRSDPDFHSDVDRLIRGLDRVLQGVDKPTESEIELELGNEFQFEEVSPELMSGLVDPNYAIRIETIKKISDQHLNAGTDRPESPFVEILNNRLSGDDIERDFRVREIIEDCLRNSNESSGNFHELNKADVDAASAMPNYHQDYQQKSNPESGDVKNLSSRALKNLGLLALVPLILILPFRFYYQAITIDLGLFILPMAAWIGFRYQAAGIRVLAICLLPTLFYSGAWGPFAYSGISGKYIISLAVCWACANPSLWFAKLKALEVAPIFVIYVVALISESSFGIKGGFGQVGWIGGGLPLLFLSFLMGIRRSDTLNLAGVCSFLCLFGAIYEQFREVVWKASLESETFELSTAFYSFHLNSPLDLLEIAIIHFCGYMVGGWLIEKNSSMYLKKSQQLAAFILLCIFCTASIALTMGESNRIHINGTVEIILFLVFTIGLLWQYTVLSWLYYAFTICGGLVLLTFSNYNQLPILQMEMIQLDVYVMNTSRFVQTVLVSIILFYIACKIHTFRQTEN